MTIVGGNDIWLAQSNDLEHWGKHQCIARTRNNMWDSARIGTGASPIKTEKGWLNLAHGVRNCAAGLRYTLYMFMTAIDDPTRV